MIGLTDEELEPIYNKCVADEHINGFAHEVAKAQLKKVAEHIKNLPTDGHDKWYYYHQELARSILDEVNE